MIHQLIIIIAAVHIFSFFSTLKVIMKINYNSQMVTKIESNHKFNLKSIFYFKKNNKNSSKKISFLITIITNIYL